MAALTWGEYKTVIRRTILKNDLTGVMWTDELLADAVAWALDGLCVHTALAKSISYEGDGETYQFTLPDDVFVPLDQAGLVMLMDTSTGAVPTYYQPAHSTFKIAPSDEWTFSVWPATTLEVGAPVPISANLVVRYYASYPHPTQDSDVLAIPLWAYTAVAYDTAIHALTSESLVEASDAVGKTSPDRGQPENNSIRQLQKWWIQMYDREMNRYPRQARVTTPR